MSDKQEQRAESALGAVMLRNAFYRDSYKKALISLIAVILLDIILVAGVAYKILNPPSPQYFPTTADGRMVPVIPLSNPAVSNSYVEQWAADAVRRSFSLDFMHWRSQLSDAEANYTPQGWKWFVDSLKASNNLNTLRDKKMVSTARVTGAPRVVRSQVVDGTYMWQVQMPVLVVYQNINRSISTPMNVTVLVVRAPVKDYSDRIAINNVLIDEAGNKAQ